MTAGRLVARGRILLVLSGLIFVAQGAIRKNSLSDKEIEDLSRQWMEEDEYDDDDPLKTRSPGNFDGLPPTQRTEMVFVGLKRAVAAAGPHETRRVSRKWGQLLITGGLEPKQYPLDDGRLLFTVTTGHKDVMRVREFVLDQPETEYFEWQQQRETPAASKPAAATAHRRPAAGGQDSDGPAADSSSSRSKHPKGGKVNIGTRGSRERARSGSGSSASRQRQQQASSTSGNSGRRGEL